jgi:hypothetical protein
LTHTNRKALTTEITGAQQTSTADVRCLLLTHRDRLRRWFVTAPANLDFEKAKRDQMSGDRWLSFHRINPPLFRRPNYHAS